jgi:DUF1680 family protein
MNEEHKLTRRLFAAAMAGLPALTAQTPATQQTAPTAGAAQIPAVPGRRPQPPEPPPFAETLTFARKDAEARVTPYPLSQVRLLAGPCKQAADANRAYLMRLAPERLLHTFHLNAGLSSSAQPLGGWEEPRGELRGHTIGHYLSACAMRAASGSDAEMKARGDEIVAELAKCQARLTGGFLSAYSTEYYDRLDNGRSVWAPFYTYHKILAGLIDMHRHAGNKQALDVASGMAEWADHWSGSKTESHMQEILRVEFGGMSESFYNLAAITSDLRWARAGDRFQKKEFITPLAVHRDELRGLHMNTHVPQAIGAARRFELTSDPRFHEAASFFWYAVSSSRTYATGGSSNNEHWLTSPGRLAAEWRMGTHHQECCCAYNMMKLTRMLYSWSADPRYFDYFERNLFNHRLGAIEPGTGHSVYFLSMSPGAWKGLCSEDRSFWCCTGTAFEEFAKLNDSIYYRDERGVSVNLFIASELEDGARGLGLRQDTRFPDEPRTSISITKAPASAWTLRLRVPSWASSSAVKVNGRPLEAAPSPGSYLHITRAWKKGDRVELDLPMSLSTEPFADQPDVRAFLYGPIVLAGDQGKEGLTDGLVVDKQGPEVSKAPMNVPDLRAEGRQLEDWIKPASAPLTFRAASSNGSVTLKPLNQLWGRYATYWNVT